MCERSVRVGEGRRDGERWWRRFWGEREKGRIG